MAAIPLAAVADEMLAALAAATGSPEIAVLDGAALLGERATMRGLRVPGRISAGGGCRLYETRGKTGGGAVALNLARADDRELLPALFADETLDPADDAAIAARIAQSDAPTLVARARELGLAIAALHEPPRPISPLPSEAARQSGRPRVLDLSALWAGPLAAHLLHLGGAEVTKIESAHRPDAMREGEPAFFDLLNRGKAETRLDLREAADCAAFLALVADADIVIEAARPRALAQLGIDVPALAAQRVWVTITGHGLDGEAAHWVGFGDDAAVAAGLSAELYAATGRIGFVGDAIADPLTGLHAALVGWDAWAAGRHGRIGVSLRDTAAAAIAREKARDPEGWRAALIAWAAAEGAPFPAAHRRAIEPAC